MNKEKKQDAETFARTRRDHETELAEDYVEMIDSLITERGQARATDLAEALGVSHVTVSKALARMRSNGLVVSPPRYPLELSEEGQEMARESRRRHDIVTNFLLKLGVPEDIANADAEGMEHHCSEATLKAMQQYLDE